MPGRSDLPSKPCAACGRAFLWRKKWERDWENVRYCSDACRRRGVRAVDAELERAILELLASRAPTASICPSEAARRVDPDRWEALMEPARQAAQRLASRGLIAVTQSGKVVDPDRARGPIRLRRA